MCGSTVLRGFVRKRWLGEVRRPRGSGCADPLYRRSIRVSMGTEGDGLSAAPVHHADRTVRIPMSHGVDSRNVAAASAVASWETRPDRQEPVVPAE